MNVAEGDECRIAVLEDGKLYEFFIDRPSQLKHVGNIYKGIINNIEPGIARTVRSDWTTLVEAQVQHPLMRNRGTLVNRIPVVLASLNEDIAITEFEVQVRNLVRDVEGAYWDLYVAYRNVATTMVGRNSAQAFETRRQRFILVSLTHAILPVPSGPYATWALLNHETWREFPTRCACETHNPFCTGVPTRLCQYRRGLGAAKYC